MQPTFPLTTTIATQSLRGEIDLVPLAFAYMRKQRLFVGNPIVHMTELRPVTKPCIAALFCARSFFQHDDFGPGVVGRDRPRPELHYRNRRRPRRNSLFS